MNLFAQHRDKEGIPEADFAHHLQKILPIVSVLMRKDKTLGGSWYLKANSRSDALRFPVFLNDIPLISALDALDSRYKKTKKNAVKTVGLWNGVDLEGDGASLSVSIDGSQLMTRRFDLALSEKDGKSRLGNFRSISEVMHKVVELYSPYYGSYGPREYFDKKVFEDRPGVSWMLYLPKVLDFKTVPEARDLIPVDIDGQRRGTIIVSVTDAVFDVNNPEHVKVANAIEIRLADQDLLPRYADL